MNNSILITGVNGFIGNNIYIFLKNKGFDVFGVSRNCDKNSKMFNIDLLNRYDLERSKSSFPKFNYIIHCAASSSEYGSDSKEMYVNNISILENTIEFFGAQNTKHIFLSSVAVYGEDRRNIITSVDSRLRPSSYYGKSKVMCEDIIKKNCHNYNILRLTPVYSSLNYFDIMKRVRLPLIENINIKIITSPSCAVHLCITNNLSNNVFNLCDLVSYSQNDISKLFKRFTITIPEFLVRPIYYFTYLFGKNRGYHLRCVYWKLFKDNVYENNFNLYYNQMITKKDFSFDLLKILKSKLYEKKI